MIDKIYVVVSTALIHLFFLVLALFIVYKYYLDKVFINKYTSQFISNYNRLVDIIVNNLYLDTDFKPLLESSNLNKQEVKNELKQKLGYKISSLQLLDNKYTSDEDKRKLLIPKLAIAMLGFIFIVFVISFKYIYRTKYNLNYSLLEIILSFTLTLILVFLYQYYLINNFFVDAIYLQIPKLIKDNIVFI